MRKYGMYITYGDDGIVTYASLKGEQANSDWIRILSWCLLLAALTGGILFLTFRRVRRLKAQDDLYTKLRELKEHHDIDTPAELIEGLQEMQLDRNILKDHGNGKSNIISIQERNSVQKMISA